MSQRDNRILLHLRNKTGFHDGLYGLVAGHLDGNETATQAAIREAKEETSIILNPKDVKTVHVMHRIEGIEYIDIFVQCSSWKNSIENLEPRKCRELRFFDKGNLPLNTIPYVRRALSNINAGTHYSEFGWEQQDPCR